MTATEGHDDARAVLGREGDEGLAALFEGARDRLRRAVALRLDPRLSDRIDPSDVLQEAYLDAAGRVAEFVADDVPLYVWLRFLTIQRLLQIHRFHLGTGKRGAAMQVSLDRPPLVQTASLAWELMGDLTSPSQALARDERHARLVHELEQLDEMDREVLALRHFEGLSNAEIATILGLTTTAASKRYLRALRRLGDALTPEGTRAP